jgi:hypothetical protein
MSTTARQGALKLEEGWDAGWVIQIPGKKVDNQRQLDQQRASVIPCTNHARLLSSLSGQ